MQVVSEGLLVFSMNEIKHILMHHIRLGDRGTNEEGQYERNNVERMQHYFMGFKNFRANYKYIKYLMLLIKNTVKLF